MTEDASPEVMAMGRILYLAVGYFAGLSGVGVSYWNALSYSAKMTVAMFTAALILAMFTDRFVSPTRKPRGDGGGQ